jgi:hypothetical protein
VGGEYWSSFSRISGFSNAAVGEPVESEPSLCTSAGDAPPLRARGEPGTLEPGLLGSPAPLAPNLPLELRSGDGGQNSGVGNTSAVQLRITAKGCRAVQAVQACSAVRADGPGCVGAGRWSRLPNA